MIATTLPDPPSPADSSFAKGLAVLGWVLDREGSRADEIAAGLGLPLSSTYRFLRTLRERHFVADADGAFAAGPRLRDRLAGMPEARIAELAAPHLESLAESTGETAVLTVRRGLHAVCLRQVESSQQIRLAFRSGQLLPLYAGAGQRVLLAFAPESVQRQVLGSGCRAFTPNTPPRARLAGILTRTRREGFALSRGELTPGSVSLAMPVLRGPDAVCALCVAGPQNRCGPAWQDAARRALAGAVDSLAEILAEAAPPEP